MSVRLIVAAVVGVVAGYVGSGFTSFNPQAGATAFSLVYGTTGFLDPNTKVQGPRLDDTKLASAAYGAPIAYIEGHPRVAGNIVWGTNKREVANEGTQSGKGGPGVDTTTYTYEMDLMILFAENSGKRPRRCWSNGALIWSAAGDADSPTLAASDATNSWREIRIYEGDSDQLPDPTYEAAVGVGNAPAYRGRSSAVIVGLNLGNNGQLPVLSWELGDDSGNVGATFGQQVLGLYDGGDIEPVLYNVPGWPATGSFAADGGGINFEPYSSNGSFSNLAAIVQSDEAYDFETSQPFAVEFELKTDVSAYGGNGVVLFGRIEVTATNYTGDFIQNDVWSFRSHNGNVEFRSPALGAHLSAPLTLEVWNKFRVERVGLVLTLFKNDLSVQSAACSDNALLGPCRIGVNGPYQTYSPLPALWGPGSYNSYRNLRIFKGKITTLVDAANVPLASVVQRQWQRAGLDLSLLDVTSLAGLNVLAMPVSQVTSPRQVLDTLSAAYLFEFVESDKVRAVRRGGAPVATVPYEDLGASTGDAVAEPLPRTRGNELELASQVTVKFSNVNDDYQDGSESSPRLATGSRIVTVVEVPLGLTPTEAKRLADNSVTDALASITRVGPFSVSRKWAHIEPTDVVLLTGKDGSTYRTRIQKRTDAGGLITFEGVLDDATAVNSSALTSGGYNSSTIVRQAAETEVELLDIPALRDADAGAGVYAAFQPKGSGKWSGAALYDSLDDVSYSQVLSATAQAVIGTTTNALGPWTGGWVFDELNSLTVNVAPGQFYSVSRDTLLNGDDNALLVGAEIIQFRSAALVSAGIYTLTGLLRGRRGTEWAMGAHTAAERVVLLTTAALRRVQDQQSDVGLARFWKGVTFGKNLVATASKPFTDTGVSEKPFAPVGLRTSRAGGDIVVTWKRRTRLSTGFIGPAGISVPLGEVSESYAVDVTNATTGSLLRTDTVPTPSYSYTTALQALDHVSSSAQVRFTIYQLSGTIGRGYPSSISINGTRTPAPQVSTVTLGGVFGAGQGTFIKLGAIQSMRTTLSGDTSLSGVAIALASVIDALADYTAAASGNVITITGLLGVPYTVDAGLTGSALIPFNQYQQASLANVGRPKQQQVSLFGFTAAAAGATFSVRVENSVVAGYGSSSLTWSATASGGESPQAILTKLVGATPTAAGTTVIGAYWNFASGFGSAPTLVTPNGEPNWFAYPFASQGQFSVSIVDGGYPIVPVDQAQATDVVLFGQGPAPVAGNIFRLTLAGIDYSYSVSSGDTFASVVAGLRTAVATGPYTTVDTTVAGGTPQFRITSTTVNLPFTYSGRLIPGSITLTAAITQPAA